MLWWLGEASVEGCDAVTPNLSFFEAFTAVIGRIFTHTTIFL